MRALILFLSMPWNRGRKCALSAQPAALRALSQRLGFVSRSISLESQAVTLCLMYAFDVENILSPHVILCA